MMKRRIIWKRVLILVSAVLGACLLGVVLLFTIGRPLVSAVRASLWTEDAERSRLAARAMVDYQLPEGYTEAKLLRVQGMDMAVMINSSQHPGDIIYLSRMEEGIRENDDWRKSFEEGWSKDLGGHRYRVRTVEVRQIKAAGANVPLRLLEGTDENGRQVKQAVCILPGKSGDLLVAVMSGVDTWNMDQVEAFYQSIP